MKIQVTIFLSGTHVSLNKHIETGKKPYKCSSCEKEFSHRDTMNIHIATIHEIIRPYKCSHCIKEFSQKMNLNRHIAKVHEGKPVQGVTKNMF